MATPFVSDFDLHLLAEGAHWRSFERLGAHPLTEDGVAGVHFAVWAPNADYVSVIGDWNGWDRYADPLRVLPAAGIWAGFLPGVRPGAIYKYHLRTRDRGYRVDKADPYAFACELRPKTASRVWDLGGFSWSDADWMARRGAAHALAAPLSIYEVHLGSWRRSPDQGNRWLTYREAAPLLAAYVRDMGYTHVEFLPLTEHPFDGSWGYQTCGYFAPTARFGTPQDLMFLIDTLHRAGIGVILDWVPAHFPTDEHGLGYFDGTHLYEHADPRQGQHQDWGSLIFNYGRREVANFLISSALFWLEKYHVDGLRVDGVASMLYLDYSRKEGEWVPNGFGGRENLEAIEFLRRLNERVYGEFPDAVTIAEESTAWPAVSRPTYVGGLGFGLKWDMGWMHDALAYMGTDPIHRRWHHEHVTFRMLYAFTENFMLPLSHDEVVHLKRSLIDKMPGDLWQKYANLRLLYGWMYAQPGKKLLFMGGDFAQWGEWNHDTSLDWHLLEDGRHRGVAAWVRDLNRTYRAEAALFELDCDAAGFAWVDCADAEASVVSFLRLGRGSEAILVACNFTPVPRVGYRVGVPGGGWWAELLNGDAVCYGGSGQGNAGGVGAEAIPWHGRPWSVALTLPPLAVVMLKGRRG